jgi:hypothetical protein
MTAPAKTALPNGWRGPIAPVNTPAGDGRVLVHADGADVPVRPLPLPLSAQSELQDGHDGSAVIGLIDRVWLADDGMVWGEGRLNLNDPTGADWAQKLADGYAGWCSVDLSGIGGDGETLQVEEVPYDRDGREVSPEQLATMSDADLGGLSTRAHVKHWKVMGCTLVSSPAFEAARIAPVYDYEPADPLVAAAVVPADEHDTDGMIALLPCPEDAARLAVGDTPPEEMHLTLAYLPNVGDYADPDALAKLFQADGPITGEVNGSGVLGGGSADVWLVNAPGLTDARNALVSALGRGEYPKVSNDFDGFLPHVTYASSGQGGVPDGGFGPVKFDRLRVALRGQYTDIPLGEPDPVTASLTAAGITYRASDFDDPQFEQPTALTITDDGRVFGHAALWGTCHIGLPDCTEPPHSPSNYAYFHTGEVVTDAGRLAVGRITLGGGHAGPGSARAAAAHYDNTCTAVAVVRCGEDQFGIWYAGHMLPGTADREDELRRSGVSGDWRTINRGPYEMVAVLAVNTPGFPVPRAIAASGRLIAAGMMIGNRRLHRAATEEERLTAAHVHAHDQAARYVNARERVGTLVRHTRMTAARKRIGLVADANPANDRKAKPLERYWTKGPGLARWAESPTPYRTLVAQLTKEAGDHMTPEQIKGLAATYYHIVFHRWPGKHDDGKR